MAAREAEALAARLVVGLDGAGPAPAETIWFPMQMFTSEDFRARASATQAKNLGLLMSEERCSLNLPDWLKKDNLHIWCLRTSKGCSISPTGKILPQSYPVWMTLGMMWSGKSVTAKISAFPKAEKGYSLSAILETEVPEKYFLSQEKTEKLLAKLSPDHKETEYMM